MNPDGRRNLIDASSVVHLACRALTEGRFMRACWFINSDSGWQSVSSEELTNAPVSCLACLGGGDDILY